VAAADRPPSRQTPVLAGDAVPAVSDVLLHRAGLPKDLAAGAGEPLTLAWPPRQRSEYSNLGYALLAEAIHTASGVSYAQFCTTEILSRYGLTDTTMQEPEA
jgi:CubicO group peptidase (beta-lactamase class C family)